MVGELLPHAADVRLETGPGGHLGVLTGRSARRTTWVWLDEFLAAHDPLDETGRAPGTTEGAAAAARAAGPKPAAAGRAAAL
jgi:hypothetical protein